MPTSEDTVRALKLFEYLNQGKTWKPNGRPPLPITEMDRAWRDNAARWLLKKAAGFAWWYGIGEHASIFFPMVRCVIGQNADGTDVFGEWVSLAPDEDSMAADMLNRALDDADEERLTRPLEWMKSTTLYQAVAAR